MAIVHAQERPSVCVDRVTLPNALPPLELVGLPD